MLVIFTKLVKNKINILFGIEGKWFWMMIFVPINGCSISKFRSLVWKIQGTLWNIMTNLQTFRLIKRGQASLHLISWLWSSVFPNPTVLASVMLYTPVGPEGCGAFTGWGNALVLCTKINTYKFCSTTAHLGQVITRAIPHRSINFRISQLFT